MTWSLEAFVNLQSRTNKKSIKEELDKVHAEITFPEFDFSKLELPDNIAEALKRLEQGGTSPNDEFEVLHYISQVYREQLQAFTLKYIADKFADKNLKRKNHELVYCPVEYLVTLNNDKESV